MPSEVLSGKSVERKVVKKSEDNEPVKTIIEDTGQV